MKYPRFFIKPNGFYIARLYKMSKSRVIGAGAGIGRANGGGGYNTAGNQGGGDKLQGLVGTTNRPVVFSSYVRTRADGGDSRNWVFCVNQLGGAGRRWGQAAGPGNRGGVHAVCKAHAHRSRQRYPRRPKQSSGWGNPRVYRANHVGLSAPPASTCTPPLLDVAGYYGASSGNGVPPTLDSISPAYNIVTLSFLSFAKPADPTVPAPLNESWCAQIRGMDTDGTNKDVFQGGGWTWTIPMEGPLALPKFKDSLDPPYLQDDAAPPLGPQPMKGDAGPVNLIKAIQSWRGGDKYGRTRYALLSLGGENGSDMTALKPPAHGGLGVETVANAVLWFIDNLDLDGLDIDVEDQRAPDYDALSSMLSYIKTANPETRVSCAPQCANTELGFYEGIIRQSDYVGVQYYNQGPGSLAGTVRGLGGAEAELDPCRKLGRAEDFRRTGVEWNQGPSVRRRADHPKTKNETTAF